MLQSYWLFYVGHTYGKEDKHISANMGRTMQSKFQLILNSEINGRRIYPFNKGLRIYGGGVPPPFWHIKNWYFY